MSVQVSYPGIYTQEFTPGAPIQGVSTSTGAFIGTATQGPINQPVLLSSWDEFQSEFGGFINEPPNASINDRSYLAPAVYGFFQNQGANCYVVRAVKLPFGFTSLNASYALKSRAASPQPELVVSAIAEGAIGNLIQVTVSDSSLMTSMLQTAASWGVTAMTAVSPVQVTTAAPNNFIVGQTVAITGSSSTFTGISEGNYTVATVIDPSNFTLDTTGGAATNGGGTYQGGFTVSSTATVVVAAANLTQGQFTFTVTLPPSPSTFVLSQAVPAGALINVSGGGLNEYATVAQVSANQITLATGLTRNYGAGALITSCEFDLTVTGPIQELPWKFLSMNPVHPNYWQTAVNSQTVTLSLPPPPAPPPPLPPLDSRPADVTNQALGGGRDDDRGADAADIDNSPQTYLNLLAPLQDVNIVAIPGHTNANAQQGLVTHCETLFNRFGILDAAPDLSVGFPNLKAQYGQVRTSNGFAAIYFPWIQVVNPLTGVTEYWPPSGHVMGIYAQTDQTRGVYKAPANVSIAGALGLQSVLTNNDQGPLNLLGINIHRVFPEQSQPLVWGARTTSTDSNWQYVNIRRLFIYLEQSIEQGIRWAVFEPNNTMLWGKLKRTITEFLNRVEADGGIIDFYVRIDAALNPPATQALGQLFIEVGIQPTYPAEFIILKIGIWQGGSSVTES